MLHDMSYNSLLKSSDMILYRASTQLQLDIFIAKMKTCSTFGETALCEVGDRSTSELDVTTSKETSLSTSILMHYGSNGYVGNLIGHWHYHTRRYSVSKRQIVGGSSRKEEIVETVAQYWAPSWVCNSQSLTASVEKLSYTARVGMLCCLDPADLPILVY